MSEPISNIPTSEARVPRMGESTRMHLSLTQTGNKRGIHKLRKTKPNEIVFASQKRCNMHQTTPIDPDIGADINYKKIFRQVNSSNPRIKCKGMQTARSILSSGKQPPIEAFIKSGIVKVLVNCLKDDAHPKVQFDAVWALTNVSSGTSEQTNSIVTDGALPNLYRLLDRPLKAANFELIEQIIWCVGNCLGDGHELRDLLVEEGFAFQILNLITNSPIILPTSLLRNLSWCMSNLSRNKTDPIDLADASKWMAAHHILIDHEDVAVKSDAIWSLYYLLDGGEDEIEMISENGFFPKLIGLLNFAEGSIRAAALKCVGTVLSGNDFYTQVGILFRIQIPQLTELLLRR